MWLKCVIILLLAAPCLCDSVSDDGGLVTDVAPRRQDDFTAFMDVMETSTDSGHNVEASEGQAADVLEKKVQPLEAFAVFGVAFRPVFPDEHSKVNFTQWKNDSLTVKAPSNPALVDVGLAQIAKVNMLSPGASSMNIFASREGLNCTCGKQSGVHRIVNGVPVKINDLPWTAALFKRNWIGFWGAKPYCGGTLINTRYVVTASHCVDGMSARSLRVRLNEEDVSKTNENEEGYFEFTVEKIMMHKNYSRRTIDNDIALLKLSSAVNLQENGIIQPACLPANDLNLDSMTATVAGWGATGSGASQSHVLRKVDVPIINNNECNTKTTYTGKITDNMICAGDLEKGGKDSCQGDSGGPLVINNGGRRTLVGIVSWGYGCARPKSPGVYARVSRYGDWILENTKDAEWCQS